MNKEEKIEKLEHMQMYFAKSFWISFILLLLTTVLCVVMRYSHLSLVQRYFPMDVKDFNFLIVLILGLWKLLIVQFTLVPALVFWGMKKCCCCKFK